MREILNFLKPSRALTLILALAVFSVIAFYVSRSWQEYRWSDWEFGDAQTMLAVRNWQEEGFLSSYFLWIPQGYSTVTKLFDTRALNHHAHGGKVFDDSGNIIRTRSYTHYPSWYAVPYGLLAKVGIYHKSIYQSLAVLICALSLLFWFLFCRGQRNTNFAILCVLLYLLTPGFQSYCDSLSNIPYNELFRFSFIYFWWKFNEGEERKYLIVSYLVYFLSCMTTFDNVVFIPLWALFYSVLLGRRVPLRSLLALALIFVSATLIQFSQNVAYMGLSFAMRDWITTGFNLSIGGTFDRGLLLGLAQRLLKYQDYLVQVTSVSLLVFALICFFSLVYATVNKKRKSRKNLLVALTFFMAGSFYSLLFPYKTLYSTYQVMQLYPFVTFLYAFVIYECVVSSKELISSLRLSPVRFAAFGALVIFASIGVKNLYLSHLPKPYHLKLSVTAKEFYKNLLTKMTSKISGDKVILITGVNFPIQPYWSKEYPQPYPLMEVYANAPILNFPSNHALVRDLITMWSHRDADFTPIVVLKKSQEATVRKLLSAHSFDFGRIQIDGISDKIAFLKLTEIARPRG